MVCVTFWRWRDSHLMAYVPGKFHYVITGLCEGSSGPGNTALAPCSSACTPGTIPGDKAISYEKVCNLIGNKNAEHFKKKAEECN